jgi:tetraacyldisaccharide 4'-kinase
MLTRSELVDSAERARIRRQVEQHAPGAVWVEATYVPQQLQSPTGESHDLATLAKRPIAAFCGIGNPSGFHRALAACGLRAIATREFGDHHAYTQADLDGLVRWSSKLEIAGVICTAKDMVKVADRWPSQARPLWALISRLQITHGLTEFEAQLEPLAKRAKSAAQ